MEHALRGFPLRVSLTLAALGGSTSLGCGYGFGNHQFDAMKNTAVAFAQALQAGDTLQMRQLSWGEVQDSVTVIGRGVPRAYTEFARPTPQLITTEGGGIYAHAGQAAFLVASTRLDSCRGGVQLEVLVLEKNPRVASVRLVPPLDSVTDDACRAAIGRF
jgi:hypothetical protein